MKTPLTVRLWLPVGLLLIACTVAVWTLPRPAGASAPPPRPATTSGRERGATRSSKSS
ncbi:hypothetical protein [Streptomyces wuyuanensis]|uniref:hypothetical protein n=1 Tax=Streptomyces wuyuanensis TaxID=1196353 RepID=UPI00380CF066